MGGEGTPFTDGFRKRFLEPTHLLGHYVTYRSFVQVQDMVNKIDDGSGVLDFEDFLMVISIFFLMVKKNSCW